jgi:hypothetical protein
VPLTPTAVALILLVSFPALAAGQAAGLPAASSSTCDVRPLDARTDRAARSGSDRAPGAVPGEAAAGGTANGPAADRAPLSSAAEWLAHAADAAGLTGAADSVLHFRALEGVEQDYQSDRTYPPFFSAMSSREAWFDPRTGVERSSATISYPGAEFPDAEILAGPRSTFAQADTGLVPAPRAQAGARANRDLDPWAVLTDWRRTPDVRVAGQCVYRDYPRIVLARASARGEERLLLDPKTALPIALEREEPHYLWGSVPVAYVYSNWNTLGSATFAASSFRIVDGKVATTRTVPEFGLLSSALARSLALPDTATTMEDRPPGFLEPSDPDTVRVGPGVFLLVNRGYTETVALFGDTVYVLDATQGETRARHDHDWIRRLFPGEHPIVLVVTDLAWPHVAGVRYWVASGATVISHAASRDFLTRVVDRRWTLAPDLLEARRRDARLSFTAVRDSLRLAGGRLTLYPIDGIGSEGALVAFLPAERFLWASDYIQTVAAPTLYASDVRKAARRVGVEPERTAAQHLPLTAWSVVESLAGAAPAEPPVVAVGDGAAQGARLQLGSFTKRILLLQDGREREVGRLRQDLTPADLDGRAAVLSVQTFETADGVAVDSAAFERESLRPLRHRSHNRSRTMALDFAGSRVTGRVTPVEGPPREVAQQLAAQAFDSNITDLVAASLPLAPGYAARLPLYVYEQGGLVWQTLRVVGSTRLARTDGARAEVWLVEMRGGETSATYWIARDDRRVLRSSYALPGGGTLSFVS